MREGTCRFCGQEGFWSWSYYEKKPVLVADDIVHKCTSRDIFPGWCTQCKQPDLLLVRKNHEFQLTEQHGLPHTCTEDGRTDIEDMCDTKCKHCSTTELFWVSVRGRWTMVGVDGNKHTCDEYTAYYKAWAEANRMNYALEKKWINSKADGSKCPKCKGAGQKTFLSRNKRLMQRYRSSEPIMVFRPCKHCKRVGMFSPEQKHHYLKRLRQKYWPWYPGIR
jgi:hypothetical protein